MGNKNDKWSALSMQDRADLIKLYIGNGITDLKTIRRDYNSYSGEEDIDNTDITSGDSDNGAPIYGGELDPAIVKPAPVKAELRTYYPIISKYPYTGHSELRIYGNGPSNRPTVISSGGYHPDYNLVTNNCSDATRCAVEQIYGEEINPFLFTTPGDVRDFLLEKGVDIYRKSKGQDSQYFEIPFATAMDLKNKEIDDRIYQQVIEAEEDKKREQKKHPNRKSTKYDEFHRKVVGMLENEKYKFQPFVEGYEIDENGNYIKKNGGRILSGNKNFNYVEQLPPQEETVPQTNNTPAYLFNPKGYNSSEIFTNLPTEAEARQKSREYHKSLGKEISSITPEEKNKFLEIRLANDPKAQYNALMTEAEKEAKNILIERNKNASGIPAINVGFEDASNSPALNDAIDFMSKWYSHPTTKAIVQKDAKNPNLIYQTVVKDEDGLIRGVDVPTRDPYMANVDYGTTVNAGYSDFSGYKSPDGPGKTGGVATAGNQIRADKSIKGTPQEKFTWMHEINHILQNAFGLYKDRDKEYADRKHEIHSYLMELRRHFGLNPGKRDYTPEDANQMINEMKKYEYRDEDGNRSYPGAPTSVNFFLNMMNDGSGVSASQLSNFLNTLADASNDNNPGIQDVMTGNELMSVPEYNNGVYSAANGGRLLSGEENTDTALNSIKPLSREEYLQKQRDNVRLKALENSLNRTEPSNPLFDNIPHDIWQQDLLSDIDQALNYLLYATSEQERTLQEGILESLRNAKYEPVIIGNNCIYTALDNYGDKYKVSGNLSFLADPSKYGFKEISTEDIKPGDLVQYNKNHMMLFDSYDENGLPLYNYSSSRTKTKQDIKKKHPYEKHNIKNNPEYKSFTFIGLPEDVELWNSNYDNYKHDYSKSIVEQLKNVSELPKDTVKILSNKKLTKKSK